MSAKEVPTTDAAGGGGASNDQSNQSSNQANQQEDFHYSESGSSGSGVRTGGVSIMGGMGSGSGAGAKGSGSIRSVSAPTHSPDDKSSQSESPTQADRNAIGKWFIY